MFRRTLFALAAAAAVLVIPQPAEAHGFSSTVYADVHESGPQVKTKLELEYDLLVVSAADAEKDDPLFRAGTAAFEAGDTKGQGAALDAHAATVLKYVEKRFTLANCTARQDGKFVMGEREGVPYAGMNLTWSCGKGSGHEVSSALFGDGEGYVKNVRTLVTYDLDGRSGSATLDSAQPSLSTGRPWYAIWWVWTPLPVLVALLVVVIMRRRRSHVRELG
ncbi:hypothetical protein [Actinoplanes solisilvae]|uniref:hypothetical protein n=1 Tax=Actinoplanes solisilvae TaxID=2486853 RepID=UPI000FDC0129|nr:hypothetical protein [Actinoplanes solisilvae]